MRVEDIKVNKRFKRIGNVLYLELPNGVRVYFYKLRDIVYEYDLYVIHSHYYSFLLYGEDDKFGTLDVNTTQKFITEHNRQMMKDIMKYKKLEDPKGEFNSYYLIDGLIVYKDAVKQLQAGMTSE